MILNLNICFFMISIVSNFITRDNKSNLVKYNTTYIGSMRSYEPEDESIMVNVATIDSKNEIIKLFQDSDSLKTREGGDFSRIKIIKKNGNQFNFDNIDGWEKAYGPISKYLTNDYFLEINIGGTEPVLIFFGYTYQSQPGWLTIISLQGPKPEIIFNQEVSLIKIVKNGKSHKLIIDYDFWERGDDNGASTRLRASADAYKSCREIYIENNELKVVPCTRTLADDKREELEENKKTNQVK